MKENTNSLNLFAPFYSISFLSVPHFNLRHHSGLTFPNSIHILFITNTVIFKKVKISRYLSCLFFLFLKLCQKHCLTPLWHFDVFLACTCKCLQFLPNFQLQICLHILFVIVASYWVPFASIIQGQHFILRRVHTLVVWAYLSSPDSRSQH